jgi:hypothetical protein
MEAICRWINDDPYVLVYLRRNPGNGNSILVVLNMSAEPRTVKLDLATLGFKRSSARNMLSALDPFGVFVGSVQ